MFILRQKTFFFHSSTSLLLLLVFRFFPRLSFVPLFGNHSFRSFFQYREEHKKRSLGIDIAKDCTLHMHMHKFNAFSVHICLCICVCFCVSFVLSIFHFSFFIFFLSFIQKGHTFIASHEIHVRFNLCVVCIASVCIYMSVCVSIQSMDSRVFKAKKKKNRENAIDMLINYCV